MSRVQLIFQNYQEKITLVFCLLVSFTLIFNNDTDLIKNVKVFDVYEGENIPKNKKSIALNVTVQSSEKTLNEKDLEKINNLIISSVESKSGAKIRS